MKTTHSIKANSKKQKRSVYEADEIIYNASIATTILKLRQRYYGLETPSSLNEELNDYFNAGIGGGVFNNLAGGNLSEVGMKADKFRKQLADKPEPIKKAFEILVRSLQELNNVIEASNFPLNKDIAESIGATCGIGGNIAITIFSERSEIIHAAFPRQEVLALVWTAVNDKHALSHDVLTDFLKYFANFKDASHDEQLAHLLFILNGVHQDVDVLIKPVDAMTDFVKIKIIESLAEKLSTGKKLPPNYHRAALMWMKDGKVSYLIQELGLLPKLKDSLHTLLTKHGVRQDEIALDDLLDIIVRQIPFDYDFRNSPKFSATANLLNESADPNYPERNLELARIQQEITSANIPLDDVRISLFYQLYETHKILAMNKALLILSGVLTEDRHGKILQQLIMLSHSAMQSVKPFGPLREEIADLMAEAKRRTPHLTDNFFHYWIEAHKKNDTRMLKSLYRILMDTEIASKIGSDLMRKQESLCVEGVLSVEYGNLVVLPHQARTAAEWVAILDLVDDDIRDNLINEHFENIKSTIATAPELIQLSKWFLKDKSQSFLEEFNSLINKFYKSQPFDSIFKTTDKVDWPVLAVLLESKVMALLVSFEFWNFLKSFNYEEKKYLISILDSQIQMVANTDNNWLSRQIRPTKVEDIKDIMLFKSIIKFEIQTNDDLFKYFSRISSSKLRLEFINALLDTFGAEWLVNTINLGKPIVRGQHIFELLFNMDSENNKWEFVKKFGPHIVKVIENDPTHPWLGALSDAHRNELKAMVLQKQSNESNASFAKTFSPSRNKESTSQPSTSFEPISPKK